MPIFLKLIMLNLFIIHWKEEELHEYVSPLLLKDWNVGYEFKNELYAKLNIEKLKPDIILIYLIVTPSRGLLSANIIRQTDSIKHIPIIFVDGKPKAIKKIKNEFPDEVYATSENLETILMGLDR